nr:MAG TPA: hypothetical protein [Caudoviricetes sp.]
MVGPYEGPYMRLSVRRRIWAPPYAAPPEGARNRT